MRQARAASIAGQSAQPTAEPKLRGLPCAGFAPHRPLLQRTVKFGFAPKAQMAPMLLNADPYHWTCRTAE